MPRRPALLLILALPSVLPAATMLERAEMTRQASGLGSIACDADPGAGIPGWFRYRPGSPYVAETAILLPVPYDDVASRVGDLEGYPDWLLLDRGGMPTLGRLTSGEDGRSARLQLAPNGEDYLEGRIESFRTAKAAGVRVQGDLDGSIKQAVLEATAFRVAGCDDRTLVTLRAEWKLGFLARTFGGQKKGLPALLLLAVRGDLVAATIRDPELLVSILELPLEAMEDGARMTEAIANETTILVPEGGRVARLLPVRIRVDGERFGPIEERLRSWGERPDRVDADDVFETLLSALDGRHELVGYWVWFLKDGRALFVPTGTGKERSFVFIVMNGRDGLSLSVMP